MCNDANAQWVDDKIHGKGKSTYANGNVYEGEVRDGVASHFTFLSY